MSAKIEISSQIHTKNRKNQSMAQNRSNNGNLYLHIDVDYRANDHMDPSPPKQYRSSAQALEMLF